MSVEDDLVVPDPQQIPGAVWEEHAGKDGDGYPFHSHYLIDKDGRCWARIDHPAGDHILFQCFLFFPEDDANFIGLLIAKNHCMAGLVAYLGKVAAFKCKELESLKKSVLIATERSGL